MLNLKNCEQITEAVSQSMQKTGVWTPECPTPIERLVVLKVNYVDFDSNERDDGEIVVLDVAAEYVANGFDAMYQQRFPIGKIRPVHHYEGNDELSMADNNSSSFCHRPIEGTTLSSLHSYGLAVDINPLQNPFVVFDEDKGTAAIHPAKGWEYLNRHNQKPGMVEGLVDLWAKQGFFIWGGKWTTPLDYHHFQTPRGLAELLLHLSIADGKRLFELAIDNRAGLNKMPSGSALQPLLDLYLETESRFFSKFREIAESMAWA